MKKRSLLLRALEKRMLLDASLPVIAGQVLWLDADDTATVLDAEGDNAASGGAFSGSVQTWQDKSGSGFHVTANAAANRPSYTTNALNGNNVLTFNGTDDWLRSTGASIAGDDYTMFVVFNRTTTAGRDAIFEIGNGGSRNALFLNDGSGANKINMYHNGAFYNPSGTYAASTNYLFTSTVNTNAYTLTQNGAVVGSGTTSTARVATTGIYVGNDSSGGDELQGTIAEILVYDRDLSADERHDIETYLASKWGLTITNAAPTVATNTGTALDEGAITTLTSAMLNASDADNTDAALIYTLTNATDNGTLFRDGDGDGVVDAGEDLLLGETFTQGDINSGLIKYLHDDSDTITDAFSFTVTDQLAVTAASTFNFTINPVLDLPVTAGAVLWLDAADKNTLKDADGDTLQTGTGGANNGFGALTTWVNKANGANNAITGGAGTPTILQDGAGYNGLTVLDFDGSDDEFVMQNHINNTDTTIFIVVNKDSVSTGWRTLYTDNDYLLLSRSPTNDQWGAYDGNSQELTSTTLTGGTFLLTYTGTNNGLTGNFRTNGVNDGSYAAGSSNNKPQTVIGDNSGATQNHSGFIGELIVFNRVLNAGEIADVEAYLNTKWFGNTAPTISAISDQTINEDGNTGALAFTVGDAETAAASLSVSATSSDTALIPNGNLVISGAGANRTITVTPTANLSGTATITVSVDDGSGGITTETFDVTVTAVNDAPIIATNTGATMNEGASVVITNAMLNEGDVDDSGAGLTYTASNLSNGHITVNGVTQNTFTQADVDGGLVVFVHDGSETLSAGFDISLADGGENGSTPATGTFSIAVTNVNDAPVIQGWNLVSSEDFQSGATGWAINTTTAGGSFLTTYLGPFSNDGGVQSNSKTYALSGTQDYTVIEFDFYRIDSWDSEAFRIWINDTQVFSQNFTQSVQTVPDGSSGVVSWTVTELITINGHAAGTSNWNDQIFRFTMTIQNSAAASIKLGFGSLTNQGTSDEAWGVDNVKVYEADGGGTPGPFGIAENSANGTVVGNVTATDPESNTITYSITGGTGAAHFAINASTGAITVTNSAALDYESITSYTLQITATDNGSPNLTDVETITINVLDIPENTAPVVNAAGPFSVAENAANNTVVGTVSATDAEGNAVTWSITGGNTDNIFTINASGQIRINSNTNLNYEWDNQYVLTVQAQDNGFGSMTGTRSITVNITDVNEAPTFDTHTALLAANPYLRYNATTGNYYQYVSTGATYAAASTNAAAQTLHGVAGHLVTITSAAENTYVRGLSNAQMWLGGSDAATEGTWVWAGSGAEGGVTFWLGNGGGSVQNGLYANWNGANPDNGGAGENFLVMLTGAGQWNDAVGTGTNTYVIEWEGTAVQAAVAALQNGPYTVAENTAIGSSVGFLETFDIDAGDTKTYSVTGGTGTGMFAVNTTTGEITLTGALDYEAGNTYTLTLRAQDTNGLFGTTTVTINVNDINDAPTNVHLSNAIIAENTLIGTVIGTLSSTDQDLPADTFTYSIQNDPDNKFVIVGNELRVNGALDFETSTSHSVTIRTDDGRGGTYDRIFTISLTDINESPTIAVNTGATVREARAVVITTAMLNEGDVDDSGAGLTYTASNLVNGQIEVNGVVQNTFTQADIDAGLVIFRHDGSETLAASFDFSLADGGEDGSVPATGTFNLTVTPDDDPVLNPVEFDARENIGSGVEIGRISFGDLEDISPELRLAIVGGNDDGLFTILPGGIIALATGKSLDYERERLHTLVIEVTDTIGQTDRGTVTINMLDINEDPGVRDQAPDPQIGGQDILTPRGFAGNAEAGEIMRDTLQNRAENSGEIIRTGLFGGMNFGKLDEIIRRAVLGEGNILRQALLGDAAGGEESVISEIIEEAQAEFEEASAETAPADVMEFLNMIGGVQENVQEYVQAEDEMVPDVVVPARAPTLQEAAEQAAQGFMRDVEAFLDGL